MSKKIGIYRITNTVDGKFYVGSSVDMDKRFYLHKNQLGHGKHRNSRLQRAWLKHGADAFQFEIVELVSSRDELLATEQRWLDETRAVELGYNICSTAHHRLGVKATAETLARMAAAQLGKRHTEETRARMSAAKTGQPKPPRTAEHRAKIGLSRKGKAASEETRAKLRAARARRAPMSQETREKMSASIRAALAAKKALSLNT